jgi:hypothetical protein
VMRKGSERNPWPERHMKEHIPVATESLTTVGVPLAAS